MFNYTEKRENLDSSLVKNVYFDQRTNTMLVELDSGASYVYDNVSVGSYAGIVNGSSAGRAYNYFRRTRPRGAGGRPFAGAVNPRPVFASASAADRAVLTPSQGYSKDTRASGGLLTSKFEVTYSVDGREYTSNVSATDLVAAAQDVATKAESLGLNAKLTGVVVKS